jgi:hypothetical protein
VGYALLRDEARPSKLAGQLYDLLTGGNTYISSKGGIPKIWGETFLLLLLLGIEYRLVNMPVRCNGFSLIVWKDTPSDDLSSLSNVSGGGFGWRLSVWDKAASSLV